MDIEKVDIQKDIDARIKLFRRRLKDLIDMTSERTKKTEAKQAQEMGTNKNNLSRYCSDIDADKERPIPKIDQLVRFANYYNVSTDYLLGYTDAEQPVTTDEGRLIRAICDYTGLSEEAVKAFHDEWNPQYKDVMLIDVVNSIAETKYSVRLIEALYSYLNSDCIKMYQNGWCPIGNEKYGHKIVVSDIVGSISYKVDGRVLSIYSYTDADASFWEPFFLLMVENELKELKQKYYISKPRLEKLDAEMSEEEYEKRAEWDEEEYKKRLEL